jgi:hypothetical protein
MLEPRTQDFALKGPRDSKINRDPPRALLDLICGPPLQPSVPQECFRACFWQVWGRDARTNTQHRTARIWGPVNLGQAVRPYSGGHDHKMRI